MKNSIVSLIKCENYEYENVKRAVEECISLIGGVKKFIKPNERVMIKPNIANSLPPERGDTTHPAIVRSTIEIVKKITKNIQIGESSASLQPEKTLDAFRVSGIKRVADDLNIEIVNFSAKKFVKKNIKGYSVVDTANFAEDILNCDKIINLPKLKSHNNTFITGAIKNCFGCVDKAERERLHKLDPIGKTKLSQGVVNIFSTIKPTINIMDAVIGMDGLGTPAGNPKKIGLILSSADAVSLDAVSSEIVGIHPFYIPTTKYAHKRNLGIGDINRIKIVGEKLENVKITDFKYPITYTKNENIKLIPVFNENCIKCMECVENCPMKAISDNLKINREKCISCFVCQEICENNGISIVHSSCEIRDKQNKDDSICKKCIHFIRKKCRGLKI